MSNQCDCGDRECAICQGRPRASRAPVLDEFMAQKAREEEARKQAARAAAQAPTVPIVHPAIDPNHQERIAASWTPPVIADDNPPPDPAEVAEALSQLSGGVQQPKKAKKAQSAFAQAYTAWQAECVKRNEWIAAQQKAWKDAVEQRRQAIAQWDAHVARLRTTYEQAKATEPPPAPRKEQFAG